MCIQIKDIHVLRWSTALPSYALEFAFLPILHPLLPDMFIELKIMLWHAINKIEQDHACEILLQ